MNDSYLDLYSVYKTKMNELFESNDFYDYMYEAIATGHNSFSLFNRFFEKKIDLRWVDAIEKCIIPLDNIIRNPRKFIVQEEEIVAIERARKITAESVRHLAQHTNLIARVEEDTVTPHHILNVFREESFEIYENRFIFTLVKQLQWFIDQRYDVLFNLKNDENMSSLKMESSVQKGSELVNFKFEISTQSAANDMSSDSKEAKIFQRIDHIKTVINEFAHSNFMKEMKGCTLVRPPIMRTNVILKDPNFRACLALWQFISSYDEVGYSITVKEGDEMVSDECRDDLYRMMSLNYLLLKQNGKEEKEVQSKLKKRQLKPKFLKRLAEELVLDYDMDEAEIRKVFVDEMKRVTKRKAQGEKKIYEAIQRALDSENEIKAAIKEKIRLEIERQKEIERRRIEREKARIAKEKALEKARIEREKARLKAKKEKELALERARKEKEREKARLAREKALQEEQARKEKERIEKEKARIAKEKAIQAEKERIAKEKAREKERIAKEKALQIEKERVAREKAKEKEKIAKEKAALDEKERVAREKAKEKERITKEKAVLAEKERVAREKAKEKERITKEKAALAEKERVAREKAKEKERIAKEKAALAEKERVAREKAKEKARIAREKAIQAEKERIAKEHAKEKARIEKEKAALAEKERLVNERAKEKARLVKEKAVKKDQDEN